MSKGFLFQSRKLQRRTVFDLPANVRCDGKDGLM
jgi:hypothetical protein